MVEISSALPPGVCRVLTQDQEEIATAADLVLTFCFNSLSNATIKVVCRSKFLVAPMHVMFVEAGLRC